MPLAARETVEGVEFHVLVSAGSSRAGIRGLHGDSLKIAVGSPPERGRANAEVLALISGWLGLPARAVCVVSGLASRRKRIRVVGLTGAKLQGAVGNLAKKPSA
jgi:uncharacterized protein (TIGR00251 family)